MNYLTDTTLLERRQDLRDHVWAHGPEHFNMAHWQSIDGGSCGLEPGFDITGCGAAACLGGHAACLLGLHNQAHFASDYDLARLFGIPHGVFMMDWEQYAIGDRTMADIYLDYAGLRPGVRLVCAFMGTYPEAEWSTVLDYLDWLIKSEIEAT